MTQSIITAGDASAGLVSAAGNDGTLVIQSGPAGAKVNALSIDATGLATLNKGVTALQLGTAQNTTSGTSIDFTGIPAGVNRAILIFAGLSANGTSDFLVRLGTSGGFVTTGYASQFGYINPTGVVGSNTTGFGITNGSAANAMNGRMTLHRLTGNSWVSDHLVGDTGGSALKFGGGAITLSGTLDRIRLTTINGTDTFDAGSCNIMWEF